MTIRIEQKLLDDLREAYQTSITERERANVGMLAHEEARRAEPAARPSRLLEATAEALGISSRTVHAHRFLVHAGDLADPLWSMLDKELTLSTAETLLRKSRHTRGKNEAGKDALQRVLTEYAALPHVRALGNGKVYRCATPKPPKRKPEAPPKPKSSPRAAAPPAPAPAKEARDPRNTVPDRAFWGELRALCTTYARAQLAAHGEEALTEEMRRLETELKVVFEEFSARVRRRKSETPLRAVISRRQLTEACRVLAMDPPPDIKAIPGTFFKQAKTRFRQLAREYHPDTSSGGEATRSQFEAVMDAWRVVQALQSPAA